MRKKIFLGVLFIFFTLFPKDLVFAQSEFATSYDVQYEVTTDGTTLVTQNITLKNLTSKYYASNFTLTIGSTTLTDVSASNDTGPLETKIDLEDKKTSITVSFREQIAGLGKEQTFSLKFRSKDFAQSIGKTWEVNLPKIPSSSNIEHYNLTLSVPISFGEPTSIAPIPKSESQNGDRLILTFTKDQLEKSGVSVNFGIDQTYRFTLTYDLENTALFPILTSVTLPPDTQYQDVLIESLNPVPLNVTVDEDGNMLAWYQLPRSSKQQVVVNGLAKLYIHSKVKNPKPLSPEQYNQLTKADTYWEKDNPLIKAALSEIFKNGRPDLDREAVELIYRYVVDTLKYDTNRVNSAEIERFGAVTALNNPESAVCMEFTDLFIALARAAGIPARELDGFAYTQNRNLRPLSLSQDLLHAWPEYYDSEKGWVMVDPTWENTSGGVDYFNKFDLNHFVMAVKGYSSETPYITDNVKVDISQSDFKPNPILAIEVTTPDAIWSGFPNQVMVKVYNQGQSIQPATQLQIITNQTRVTDLNTINLAPIPPYGYIEHTFKLRTPNVWQTVNDTLEIRVAGQKYIKVLEIKPLLYSYPIPYLFLSLIVVVAIVYISVLYRHIYVKKQFDKKIKKDQTASTKFISK